MTTVARKGVGDSPSQATTNTVIPSFKKQLRNVFDKLGSHPRKHLDDDEILGVLDDMVFAGHSVDSVDKVELKRSINQAIYGTNVGHAFLAPKPAHEYVEELEQVQRTLEQAQKAINLGGPWRRSPGGSRPVHHHRLALELDRLDGRPCEAGSLERWRAIASAAYPDDEQISTFLADTQSLLGSPVPSNEAMSQVEQALSGLDLLVRLVGLHVATLKGLQTKQPKKADHGRYRLVLELARDFETIFRRPATRTREGPCCCFLAGVLSRCERKRLSPAGAWSIWKKAEDWLKESSEGLGPVLVPEKNFNT